MNARIALLSPPGAAALASIGCWGPDAGKLLQPSFSRPLSKPGPLLGHLRFGDLHDQVVLLRHDFAGSPAYEICCHGGATLVRGILEYFTASGATQADWTAWLAIAEGDALRAEAAQALVQAPTFLTADHLLHQYHGALRRELLRLEALLAEPGRLREAKLGLAALRASAAWGLRLTQPWKLLLAGPPNAGKSSLINALLGYARSITSPQPGTTRDLVTAAAALAGWPVEWIDSAGYRANAVGVEAAGIASMREQAAHADLVLWLAEAAAPVPPPDFLGAGQCLRVASKADLLAESANASFLCVSAKTGQGLADLEAAVLNRLLPEVPSVGAPTLFHPRQWQLLARAEGQPPEVQAALLRQIRLGSG